MDICDGSQMMFMAPLELNDEFLVPEAVAAANDLSASTSSEGASDQ